MQTKKQAASAGGRVAANADDVSIFDEAQAHRAANDNRYIRLIHDDPEYVPRRQKLKPFKGDELRAEIPADKAAARAWLDAMGIGASVSLSAACAKADLPVDRGWRGEIKEPAEPSVWKPRKRNSENSDPENWPIMESLRRDRRHDDIPLVVRYESLVDTTGAEPVGSNLHFDGVLAGSAGSSGDEAGLGVEMRSLGLHGVRDVDRAHKAGWPGDKVPGGNISYREARRSVQNLIIGMGHRTLTASDDTTTKSQAALPNSHPEDAIIERMDGRPVLGELRRALGGLGFVFEDAVLARWTLTSIGERLGYKHKARSAKAKVLVYTAIDKLRDRWRLVDRELAGSAAACNRRVDARRREIATNRAAYFGHAA